MMKFKTLITLFCLFQFTWSFCQISEQYNAYVIEADSSYAAENYQLSAARYKAAFDELDGKAYPNDRYNAACSYALAEDVENAFYHLFYLAENPKILYRDLNHISTDVDLSILHPENRWNELLAMVKDNKQAFEKDLDLDLVNILNTVYDSDQGLRLQIGEITQEFGNDSEEMKAHWDLIREADSINELKVIKILKERGWLGPKVITDKGNLTLFLVIQHAALATQEKYLPMMREAVVLGNANGANLALLEDRIAMRNGKQQVYGSQIRRDPETNKYYVYPVIEPEKVNERRAEVGLGAIETYVFQWEIEWDVEQHLELSKEKGF